VKKEVESHEEILGASLTPLGWLYPVFFQSSCRMRIPVSTTSGSTLGEFQWRRLLVCIRCTVLLFSGSSMTHHP